MDNQQVTATPFEIGYLIGILEGEGCFVIVKRITKSSYTLSPVIEVYNTNEAIIESFVSIMFKLNLPCYVETRQRSKNWKPIKQIRITGLQRVYNVLSTLMPYIKCRKDQAEILFKFCKSRLEKNKEQYRNYYDGSEQACYAILRDLNTRGV